MVPTIQPTITFLDGRAFVPWFTIIFFSIHTVIFHITFWTCPPFFCPLTPATFLKKISLNSLSPYKKNTALEEHGKCTFQSPIQRQVWAIITEPSPSPNIDMGPLILWANTRAEPQTHGAISDCGQDSPSFGPSLPFPARHKESATGPKEAQGWLLELTVFLLWGPCV